MQHKTKFTGKFSANSFPKWSPPADQHLVNSEKRRRRHIQEVRDGHFYLYLIKVKSYCNSLKSCNHCKKGDSCRSRQCLKKNVRKLPINVGARNTCECTRNNCNICTRRILLISGDQGRVIVTDSNFNHACSGLFNRANWLKYVRTACYQSVCM